MLFLTQWPVIPGDLSAFFRGLDWDHVTRARESPSQGQGSPDIWMRSPAFGWRSARKGTRIAQPGPRNSGDFAVFRLDLQSDPTRLAPGIQGMDQSSHSFQRWRAGFTVRPRDRCPWISPNTPDISRLWHGCPEIRTDTPRRLSGSGKQGLRTHGIWILSCEVCTAVP